MSDVLGIKIDTITFNETLARIESYTKEPRFHLVTTVNPEFILTAGKDSEFKNILNTADLSLPDGVGVLMARKYLDEAAKVPSNFFRPLQLFLLGLRVGFFTKLPERVAGADLFLKLVEQAASKGWSIGLLGGEGFGGEDVCNLTRAALLKKFPNLKINYCFRESTKEIIVTPVDLLFVAFGHPRQEKWLWQNRQQLANVRLGMGVGASFDFVIGKQRRAPELWRQLKLEWLWRMLVEPSRFKRIFRAYPVFPLQVFLSSLH